MTESVMDDRRCNGAFARGAGAGHENGGASVARLPPGFALWQAPHRGFTYRSGTASPVREDWVCAKRTSFTHVRGTTVFPFARVTRVIDPAPPGACSIHLVPHLQYARIRFKHVPLLS